MKSMEQRRFEGHDAQALIDNPILRAAFDGVSESLEQQALSCNPDDKDKTARIICAKQILAGIKREIVRFIEDGGVAEIQLQEIDRKRGLRAVFRR